MFRSIVRFLPSRFSKKKKKKKNSDRCGIERRSRDNVRPFSFLRPREKKSRKWKKFIFFFSERPEETERVNSIIYSPIRWIKRIRSASYFLFLLFRDYCFLRRFNPFFFILLRWNGYFFLKIKKSENARFLFFSVKFLSIRMASNWLWSKNFSIEKGGYTRISEVRGIRDWFEWKVHRGKRENFFSQKIASPFITSFRCIYRAMNRVSRERGARRTNSCQFLYERSQPRFRSRLIASRSGARDAKKDIAKEIERGWTCIARSKGTILPRSFRFINERKKKGEGGGEKR